MDDYSELCQLKAKLDAHRPIDAKSLAAVQEKFQLEWTYHSNALEGNPLNLSETSFFIREGLTSKGKPLFAYLEAKNHAAALGFLEQIVKDQTQLTEHLIKHYHAMLFEKIDYVETPEGRVRVEGGRYKTEKNHVIRLDGQIHQFTDPLQVTGEMEELIEWYKAEKAKRHPIELAGFMHYRLASIHPFTDGNGRVSRLVMNTVLMQAGYTPAIIPVEEKRRYLEALQSADDGQMAPFYDMIEQQVAKTLRLTIEVIEGREAFDFDDLSKMFQSIVEKTKAIEQSLGAAITPPEVRSNETAGKIRELVRANIREHVRQIKAIDVPVSTFDLAGTTSEFMRATTLQVAPVGGLTGLQITSQKRTVPGMRVLFGVFSGRSQVQVAASVELDSLEQPNHFQPRNGDKFTGSIFFEDWDLEVIRNFVVEVLKKAYKAWGFEVERRNEVISLEEAELNRQRSRRE